MNFEDEHYVRIYTRDTKTWLKWGWEGQALFCLLDRKFDKAGVLDDIDDPVEDLALHTGMPVDIVRVGWERLLKSGTLELRGGRIVCPKYIEANTAKKTDRLRAAESRARRAAEARETEHSDTTEHGVTQRDEPNATERDRTPRDDASQNVTEPSQDVTHNHDQSRPVTFVSLNADTTLDRSTQINAVQDTTQSKRVTCPAGLTLTEDQIGTLETGMMIPRWAISAITADRLSVWVGDKETTKTMRDWRNYLLGAVKNIWQDPTKRPKKQAISATPDDIKRARDREAEAEARDEAERQARLSRIANDLPDDIDATDLLEGVS
jgi:hypothetical protein